MTHAKAQGRQEKWAKIDMSFLCISAHLRQTLIMIDG